MRKKPKQKPELGEIASQLNSTFAPVLPPEINFEIDPENKKVFARFKFEQLALLKSIETNLRLQHEIVLNSYNKTYDLIVNSDTYTSIKENETKILIKRIKETFKAIQADPELLDFEDPDFDSELSINDDEESELSSEPSEPEQIEEDAKSEEIESIEEEPELVNEDDDLEVEENSINAEAESENLEVEENEEQVSTDETAMDVDDNEVRTIEEEKEVETSQDDVQVDEVEIDEVEMLFTQQEEVIEEDAHVSKTEKKSFKERLEAEEDKSDEISR